MEYEMRRVQYKEYSVKCIVLSSVKYKVRLQI